MKKWRENPGNRERERETSRSRYFRNRHLERQNKIKELTNVVKLHYGCANPNCVCKSAKLESVCYDFHHIDAHEKCFCISKAGRSLAAVSKEINKCCVLCSNCHRLETYGLLDATNFQRCNISLDTQQNPVTINEKLAVDFFEVSKLPTR